MRSKLIFLLVCILNFHLFAQTKTDSLAVMQDTLKVKLNSTTSKRVVLYGIEGARKKYVGFADSDKGEFYLVLPKNLRQGMYRLILDQKTLNFLDFLYLGEGIYLQLDLAHPDELPLFENSEINTRYYTYLNSITKQQQKIDSLQISFFQQRDSIISLESLKETYLNEKKILTDLIEDFEKKEKNEMLKDIIKAKIRTQSEELIEEPFAYFPFTKKHYFDRVDFNNPHLVHSSVLADKATEYVFYLTSSEDPATRNKLYKEAVSEILQKIDNEEIKAGFIQIFIQGFARQENVELTNFMFSEYYDKLPQNLQNQYFKTSVQQSLTTVIGRIAPDITWTENKRNRQLSKLNAYDNYIILFWSTTCSHCLKDIPKFYEYVKKNKNIKVIAVGLETEESRGNWKSETYYYPEFSHILGLDKWRYPIARDYNVFNTPNYFILDANKKIIGKPTNFEALKEFMEDLETDD